MNSGTRESQESEMPVDGISRDEWPCCLKWGTLIPSIEGPYGVGWEAHNHCPKFQHGWFRYRKSDER